MTQETTQENMKTGSYNTHERMVFGPFRLPKRAITALEQANIMNPEQLLHITPKDLRAIKGFGDVSYKHVMSVRKKRSAKRAQKAKARLDPHEAPVDIVIDVEKAQKKLREGMLTIRLNPHDEASFFKQKHLEWMRNVCKAAPSQFPSEQVLVEKLIRAAMANDPTKGGTRGVPAILPNGEKGFDFDPSVRV